MAGAALWRPPSSFCVAGAALQTCRIACSTLYTPHSTLHTLHSTLHSTLYTLHFRLYSPHSTLHSTLHTAHSTLHTLQSTLHTSHFTLYTPHFALHTLHTWCQVSHHSLTPPFIECIVMCFQVSHHPSLSVLLCDVTSHTTLSLSVLLCDGQSHTTLHEVKVIRNSEDCFPTSFDHISKNVFNDFVTVIHSDSFPFSALSGWCLRLAK